MQNEFALPYNNVPSLKRSEGGLAILYDQLTSPKKAVQALVERKPYGLAVLVIVLSVVSKVAAGLIVPSNAGPFGGASLFVLLCFAQLVITVVFTIIAASVYHFAATNEYRLGDAKVLFLLVAVCLLPEVFAAPIAVLMNGLPVSTAIPVWVVCAMGLWLWGFILQIIAVKNYYEISVGRSFFAVILPFILMSVLGLAVILMVFTYIVVSMRALVG